MVCLSCVILLSHFGSKNVEKYKNGFCLDKHHQALIAFFGTIFILTIVSCAFPSFLSIFVWRDLSELDEILYKEYEKILPFYYAVKLHLGAFT